MKQKPVSSVWLLAAVLLMSLPAEILAQQAGGENEWQAVEPGQNEWQAVGDDDQQWIGADPDAGPKGVLEPRHRRMPNFFLSTSLFYSPEPILSRSDSDSCCRARLEGQSGMAIDFDYRFWYVFIGTHVGFGGNDGFEMREYAVRSGAIIPLGERFSIIGAGWIGGAKWTAGDSTMPVEELSGDQEGLQLGASLGIRYMINKWFGLSGGVGLSTIFFVPGSAALPSRSRDYESSYQISTWHAQTGLLFTW